eukprot:TRINITY_DN13088_c0_g1_i7.p1 TRINITY_DN13088_c0_g1~~TRINITY_DN13088_c0_g1_i7.p1  ORF type:complete len:104 (-),score=25.15 TRINITY_DN13088_c0_g1_i7:468-779(-)
MIRRPPRSTLSSSSAASDVYKRQLSLLFGMRIPMYQPQYVNVMPFEPSFNVGSSSSSYNSPQVHIRSVSPLRTRATSNWDTFRTEHGNLGWTRAEMSENYHNR